MSAGPCRRRRRRSSPRPRAGPASRPSSPASLAPASSAGRDSSCSVLFDVRLIARVALRVRLIRYDVRRRETLADRGDLRSRKSLQHCPDQRVIRHLVPQVMFAALLLLAQGGLAGSRFRAGNEPARTGPLAEQLADAIGEIARRSLGGTKFDAAGLECDQMHTLSQMRADHRLAPL